MKRKTRATPAGIPRSRATLTRRERFKARWAHRSTEWMVFDERPCLTRDDFDRALASVDPRKYRNALICRPVTWTEASPCDIVFEMDTSKFFGLGQPELRAIADKPLTTADFDRVAERIGKDQP